MAKGTVFSLENLKLLDFGRIGEAFNLELERVVKDCLDRPGDDKSRKVSINFLLAPVVDRQRPGDCDEVIVECEITSSIPKRKTKVYTMSPHVNGTLSFNPDLSDEPDQETMFDKEEKRDDQRR